jgi:hypothetical protein
MKKFTTIALAAAVAMFGATAMAQPSAPLNVEIQVEQYAELNVVDDQIILHLPSAASGSSGLNDGPNGKAAQLTLQATYRTNLTVTAGASGLMTSAAAPGNNFLRTVGNVTGAELGCWPQISGPAWSGQSQFSWDGVGAALMDSLHRTDGNAVAHGGDGTGTGTGIPAGPQHDIQVGVAGELNRTVDGSWAPADTYEGDVVVTVSEWTP